jgi:hypothetical protein
MGRMPDLKAIHFWIIGDSDGDGMLNIGEILKGRNPYFDERKFMSIWIDQD